MSTCDSVGHLPSIVNEPKLVSTDGLAAFVVQHLMPGEGEGGGGMGGGRMEGGGGERERQGGEGAGGYGLGMGVATFFRVIMHRDPPSEQYT